jgi:amino acid permease
MRAARLRVYVIGLIVVAAVLSFIGNRADSKVVNALGFAAFLAAVLLYAYWRRAVRNERAARVFDREAKTDETRTRTDQ